MPEQKTLKRARADKRAGKAPTSQAGEFVREEIHHVREGKHGARSTKQAIAIGLSKARRAGVRLPAKKGTSARTRAQAKRDLAKGRKPRRKVSSSRSRAVRGALKREGHSATSSRSLAKHARSSARKRSASQRSAAAKKPFTLRARRADRPRRAKRLGRERVTVGSPSQGSRRCRRRRTAAYTCLTCVSASTSGGSTSSISAARYSLPRRNSIRYVTLSSIVRFRLTRAGS